LWPSGFIFTFHRKFLKHGDARCIEAGHITAGDEGGCGKEMPCATCVTN
jgi:hypothetical protein